jgi:hypothetical protein
MKQHISTFRPMPALAERLGKPEDTHPLIVGLRLNFSAGLRAAVDSFIAAGAAIKTRQELRKTTEDTLFCMPTPKTLSIPLMTRRHYVRYAASQGQRISALYNSALLAALA